MYIVQAYLGMQDEMQLELEQPIIFWYDQVEKLKIEKMEANYWIHQIIPGLFLIFLEFL